MSDIMRPVPFEELLYRILGEYRNHHSIFGVNETEFYEDDLKAEIKVWEQNCSTPLGPAAGPHTQLTQNIITSYLVGARFIELKTVQVMDTLEIAKPCIDARDEGYNVEWSTEFTLPKAYDEYLKAWVILHMLDSLMCKKEWKKPSFIFNASVGYNLEGIKTEKMQTFINSLKDANLNPKFKEYTETAKAMLDEGLLKGTRYEGEEKKVKAALDKMSSELAKSVTISTMHGCPPTEIEAICNYMLKEKHLFTFVKLNPTLLGYDKVRGILDNLGYNYIGLKRESFEHDLQYPDAVKMLHRLVDVAKAEKLGFGVKLTNTLGSVNDQKVLPGDEMYMSGRTLLPISTSIATLLSKEFNGELPVSYSGGANALTVKDLFEAGIRPITVATDMLKPGGYTRLTQMVNITRGAKDAFKMSKIDVDKIALLAEKAKDPTYYISKEFRGLNKAKVGDALGLTDCYVAPCVSACPIHQDIPDYIHLAGEGKYAEALALIYEKNALPNITGWICDHQCQNHCTRMDYEGPVQIRAIKKLAAEKGYDEYKSEIWSELEEPADVKAVVIGAGPSGLSTALFLARAGFDVTIKEREKNAGGVVKNVIPNFRIPEEVVQKDIDFVLEHGVKIEYGVELKDETIAALKANYDYLFYCVGAEKENKIKLEGNGRVMDAISFLADSKEAKDLALGKNIVICGGGNTAMDAARQAIKTVGVKDVTVVYRRSILEMPADREEYKAALQDGVKFMFLTNPKRFEKGELELVKMALGEADATGRCRPVETDETITLACDALITATGEKADSEMLKAFGFEFDEKGKAITADATVSLVGDVSTGPTTVVRCIAEARKAVNAAINAVLDGIEAEEDDECDCGCHESEHDEDCDCGCHESEHDEDCDCGCHDEQEDEEEMSDEELEEAENQFFAEIRAKKAKITFSQDKNFAKNEAGRCLECSYLCNKCVEVCPNRANVAIDVRDTGLFEHPYQIVHLDAYCNECGNCETFCPHDGGPYKKKFTIFSSLQDFENSQNSGFVLNEDGVEIRLDSKVLHSSIEEDGTLDADISDEIKAIIEKVFEQYSYLLGPVED